MRSILAGLLVGAFLSTPLSAADFASRYAVKGTSPGGGGDYSGSVTIKQTGEATYQVVWTIGNQKFDGTGIGGPTGLAVAYKSGADTGIAIYREAKDGGVEGFWTFAGGKTIGTERWSPQ